MGFIGNLGAGQRAGALIDANNQAMSLVSKINQTGFVDGNDMQRAANIVAEVQAARPGWGSSGIEQFAWQRNMSGAMEIYNRVATTYAQENGQMPGNVSPGYQPGLITPPIVDNSGYYPNQGQVMAGAAIGAMAGFALLRGMEHNRERGFERMERREQQQMYRQERQFENRTFEPPNRGGWHRR